MGRLSTPGAELDIEAVDAAVQSAIAAGEAGRLRVLGYGEITLVLGWPSDEPAIAVKRLPAFPTTDAVERYTALLGRYISMLEQRGVPTVPTRLLTADGTRPYLVQPLARPDQLLTVRLASASAEEAAALLARLAELVALALDGQLGMDAQPSNWIVEDGDLHQLDLSTPMLRTPSGGHELDVGVFISIYPWILRGPLRPVAASVMSAYFDRRTVLLDIAGNLTREGLGRWVPGFLEAANTHVPKPITVDDVRRYVTRDKLLWQTMQRLRRLDRAWQRRVRRRAYPFLLPPPYRYGPQQLS